MTEKELTDLLHKLDLDTDLESLSNLMKNM